MTGITQGGGRLLREDVGKREWVDFVKGAAIILIVAYHTALFLTSIGFDSAGIGRLKVVLELFPMPAFFLISGMFHNRVPSWSFPDLWRRRLRQYLYLYVVWSVLRFAFYLVAPNVRADGAGTSATDPLALLGILVWPISSYWFIYALFIFTLVLWLFRSAPPWVLLLLALGVSVLSSSGILDFNNVGWDRMTEYLVFFVFGAYFSKQVYARSERLTPWVTVALVVGFVAYGLLVTVMPMLNRVPGVATVGQVLMIAVGFALAYYLVHLTFLKWIVYVGVRSLNIYLVHVFVIALLAAVVSLFPLLDELPGRGMIVITAVTAAVVSLSILITRYLTRVSWLFVYPFDKKRRRRGASTLQRTPAKAEDS